MEYGCQLWSTSLTEGQINALEDIKKRACRVITWDITTGLFNAILKSGTIDS